MCEIRIVGPGKTRGYPYPVCKKLASVMFAGLALFCLRQGTSFCGIIVVNQCSS